MFFCDKCKDRNRWPKSWLRSRGSCEVCGQTASCNDVPSKYLSNPNQTGDTTKMTNIQITQEDLDEALQMIRTEPNRSTRIKMAEITVKLIGMKAYVEAYNDLVNRLSSPSEPPENTSPLP